MVGARPRATRLSLTGMVPQGRPTCRRTAARGPSAHAAVPVPSNSEPPLLLGFALVEGINVSVQPQGRWLTHWHTATKRHHDTRVLMPSKLLALWRVGALLFSTCTDKGCLPMAGMAHALTPRVPLSPITDPPRSFTVRPTHAVVGDCHEFGIFVILYDASAPPITGRAALASLPPILLVFM